MELSVGSTAVSSVLEKMTLVTMLLESATSVTQDTQERNVIKVTKVPILFFNLLRVISFKQIGYPNKY